MNPEIQRTVAQLGTVGVSAQRLTLAVYATRRAGWGAPLDVFFGAVAPTIDGALTALTAVAAECGLTEQQQVAMLLRYFDQGGSAPLVDYLYEFGRQQRELRQQAELSAFANTVAYGTAADEQALVAELERPLPPPPGVAVAPQANAAEAAAALQHAASGGYVPPTAYAPAPAVPPTAPPPVVYAPAPPPTVCAPQPPAAPAVSAAPTAAPTPTAAPHVATPPEWRPAPTLPSATPGDAPTAALLPAGTRVAYQLGPHALLATIVRAGPSHAEIRTDQGHVYESVAWQYLVPSTAPLVVAVTATPAVSAQIATLAAGPVPADVAPGTVLCCVACTEIAAPGTGSPCQLILDLIGGTKHDSRVSMRLENHAHEVLASAVYELPALFAAGALRMHYHDRVIGIDLTLPAATAAAVPARKRRTTKTAPGPLPNQTALPLEATALEPA